MCKKLLMLLPFMLLFISCENEEPQIPSKANRTILVYIMGENSLSSFIEYDVNEVKQAVTNGVLGDNNNLIVYIDDNQSPRLVQIKRYSGKTVCDTIRKYEEQISVKESVMYSVLSETFQRFPSESYGLVLWSHGDGWLPDTSRKNKITTRWIGTDEGNYGPKMEISELANILKQFPKLEFLFFDACFMQSIEVAYELKNYTKYIMGSVTETPGIGAPYHHILKSLYKRECDIEGMISDYYDYYLSTYTNVDPKNNQIWAFGCAISAIDCTGIDDLASETRKVITAHANELNNVRTSGIQKYDRRVQCCYYDFNGFIQSIATDEEYQLWKTALDKCIPKSFRKTTETCYSIYVKGPFAIDRKQYNGVATYIMQPEYVTLNSYYKNLKWYEIAGWNQIAF